MISVGLAKVLPGWECAEVEWLRGTNLVLLLTLPVLIARILRQNEETPLPTSASTTSMPKQDVVPTKKRTKALSRREIEALQQRAKLELPPTPSASHEDLPEVVPPTIPVETSNTTHAAKVELPKAPKRKEATPYTMAVACTISFLPPLWFFGFLYYTDLASIWLVLACLTLYNDYSSSTAPIRTGCLITFTSIMAVLVRQTNLAWVLFCAAQSILSQIDILSGKNRKGLVEEVKVALQTALGKDSRGRFWKVIALNVVPMLPMLAGCAWFVRWNGSIVLGDKANHQAGLHFPQLGYFLVFASFFGLFPLLFSLSPTRPSNKSHPRSILGTLIHTLTSALAAVMHSAFGSAIKVLRTTLVTGAFYYAVEKYTIDHPFLLADNRHYTFYIWRLFRRNYTSLNIQPKFAVVPVYTLALTAWSTALSKRGALLSILLAGATAATLVPTPLVEPRYFLIPYLLLRIYSQPETEMQGDVSGKEMGTKKEGKGERDGGREKWIWLGLGLALFAVVNAVTVGLFVRRPFEWPAKAVDVGRGEGTTMRFIW